MNCCSFHCTGIYQSESMRILEKWRVTHWGATDAQAMLPGTFKKGGSIIPVHKRHGGSVLLWAKIDL